MHHRNSLRAGVMGAAIAAVFVVGSSARADEVRTIVPPQQAEAPPGPDPMLGLTGLVVLGVPYGLSVVVAATSDVPSDHWLYLPVGGPLADIIARGTCQSADCRGNANEAALPLVIDGLTQAAGAAILVTTFASAGRPPASAYAARARVRVVPASYAGGGGVAAFGVF
jgi:hypothetical protein